jgi:phosphate transport system permease protein
MSTTINSRSSGSERVRDEAAFQAGLKSRHFRAGLWKRFFQAAIWIGIIALIALLLNVLNRVFGIVAVQQQVDPATLAEGRAIEDLGVIDLATLLTQNLPSAGRVLVRDVMIGTDNYNANREAPLSQLITGFTIPAMVGEKTLAELNEGDTQALFIAAFTEDQLRDLVYTDVVGREVVEAWTLSESLFNRAAIDATVAEEFPGATVQWNSWLDFQFLTDRMATVPAEAGIRNALFGTLWVLLLTVLVAFPLGVGTAIYLEEYSTGDNWFERLIETNIRNLAGVPSIIYGLLGLAIFVRALEGITQGRTVLSAALTMALLILPVIIINAQEALRAVPSSIREASYGLGATRWQTIWNQVLPAALPGILTGTILGMSRAIGETAPLIIIGASTFIAIDPSGPFSKFTVIPIQVYNWTKQPAAQFQDIAAAAIVLLLVVLLLFNATAIILRQRFRKALSG